MKHPAQEWTSLRDKKPVELIREYFQGKMLSQEFSIRVDISPARFAEQAYFVIRLSKDQHSVCSVDSVFSGLFSKGRPSQLIHGWADGDYFDIATFPDGIQFSLNEMV